MTKLITRREFALAAGLTLGGLLAGCAPKAPQPPSSSSDQGKGESSVTESTTTSSSQSGIPASTGIQVIDLHCDTVGPLGLADFEPYATLQVPRRSGTLAQNDCEVSASRLRGMQWAQCYAVWTPDDCPSASYREFYRTGADWFLGQMRECADTFAQVRDFRDIPGILAAGKVAAILTVENAAALEEGLEVVDEYAADGVKIAGLTWNGRNALGSGHESETGLTKLGRQYVAALEERGIVVDVSHLNDAGFWELEKIATRPFIATHSNARAVCKVPRNLTDDQFRAIAERGGIVGLNYHQDFVHESGEKYDFDQLIAHVEHWLELGGEDVIALGADRDGSTIPAWLADCSAQKDLYDQVEERLGETIARKLFAENALRFLQAYEA